MDLSLMFKTDSSNEAKELLKSLPTCHAWGLDLCLYKGSWQMSSSLNAVLLSEKHFQARDTDIVIVTLPKSGTTWLKSLVFAITKRSQYPISDPNHPLHSANSHELVPFIEYMYGESENPDLSRLSSPRLFSSHSAYSVLSESVKSTNSRIIYLCRDQKDILISGWHFMNKLVPQGISIPLEEAFELFCKGINLYGPNWDHVLGYWNASLKDSEKFLFLRYEDLKGDIASQVKKIADFTGFPFSPEEEGDGIVEKIVQLCSFESLRNLPVNEVGGKRVLSWIENTLYFRKGETGDWMNYLTPSMAQNLHRITEHKFKGTGLNFK